LNHGEGKEFRDDMKELIELLNIEIPKVFSNQDYENQKDEIIGAYEEKRDILMKDMTDEAKEHGFGVKTTNSGLYFMPIIDGVTLNEEEFENLPEDQKDEILERSDAIKDKASDIMREMKEFERKAKKEISDLDYKIGMFTIGPHITALQEKYKNYDSVIKYIADVQEDILENIHDFIEEEPEEDENMAAFVPFLTKKSVDVTEKYEVNLLVDNSGCKGAPVIIDFNPTYYNLVGEIEYDTEFGNMTTDYKKIKPGLFHQANGGYLILQAQDLMTNAQSWEALKRIMRTKEITIDSLRDQLGGLTLSTLKPEPIPVNVKVIVIGSSYIYNILYEYEEDFQKLFKIRADFDYEMDYNAENIKSLAKYIKGFEQREKTAPFDVGAVSKVIEYASRVAENQNKLTTRFNKIVELLCEASTWARLENAAVITLEHVRKAIYEKINRSDMYEEKMNEVIEKNIIMIDTVGRKVGQINGLAVLDVGDYTFGKPTRITATTYTGRAGIVNIEKEADLSGSIHDKGVQVITGYLGQTFAQEYPLSLSCRLCFEQNYNGVDGDSASSTELYAILSSLSEIALNQEIAVTGSINQFGQIQPIGGVTHKIEGFFDLCYARGLTGKQGVIIPYQNISDLVLKNDVIEAVKEGKFSIYPIEHINEGIEILTDVDYEQVNIKVLNKLKHFYKSSTGEIRSENRKRRK
jgi:lon-related putative ATP-dependent protease